MHARRGDGPERDAAWGKPAAAVVPTKGVDAETLALGTSRKFLSILRRSFRELDAGQSISLAEMRRRIK